MTSSPSPLRGTTPDRFVSSRRFLALALCAILGSTLFPDFGARPQEFRACVVCGERGVADALVNLILFLPLGAGLALRGWRRSSAILGAAMLSACIELAQIVVPGRDPSLGDVIFNSLGGSLGFSVARSAPLWLRPPRAQASRWVSGAAGALAAAAALTGVVLSVSLPRSTYYGQWTANLGHLEWYRGRVLQARLGDMRIPPRRLADSETARELLARGAPLTVHALAGPRPPGLAPIVSIYDEQQREIILIGPDRNDLVLRVRTRAGALRLDQPDLRVRGAMRGIAPGDTLRITVRRDGGGYCLLLNGALTCRLGFTIGSGWAILLYPEIFPSWVRSLLSFGWLGGLVVPVGYWIGDRRSALLGLATASASAAFVPLLVGLLPCPPLEWAGLAAGVTAGVGLRRWLS